MLVDALGIQAGVEDAGGPPWVQVLVTGIVTLGVVAAAGLSALGVRRAGAAKDEAATTREENRMDHGRVADALLDLRNEISALKTETSHRFDQLGQSVGAVRDAHVHHLEWHIGQPKEPRS